MRNLKKLFAVLIAVAMIASLMVPALAAVAYQDEALKLQAIKVFAGGPDDLKLDEGVTRAQGIAFAIRVAGKEAEAQALTDEEVDEILADWVDASDLTGGAAWARKYVAYAVKTGMTLGVGGQRLAALEDITGTSLMVFVMKAMGYSEATTANIAELVVEKGVMSEADADKFAAIQSGLIRDDAAGILYNAFANGVNKDGTKLIDSYIASGAITEADAIAAGFVEGLASVSVSAIGARKLEVSFNVAVDSEKATIEVKRGTVKPSVKSITWAEDKKSAVIEFNTDMAAGDYTVTVTGLAEEALTATTKVEAAKLTTIRFLSGIAIRNTDGSKATTTIIAENQYGENITKSVAGRLSVNTSKGEKESLNADSGLLTLQGTGANPENTFKVDETVNVTIVDPDTATVVTKTLVIANAAQIESIEFGVLTTDKDDLKGAEINVKTFKNNYADYYLPITVKDQYGNVMNASVLNDEGNFKLLESSNGNIINFAATKVEDKDGATVIKFDASAGDSGTVVVTAIGTATGKTANTTIEVKANPVIDIVTINAPEKELKQDTPVVLPLDIIDSYGNEVALYDLDRIGVDGGKLELYMSYTDAHNHDKVTTITANDATFEIDIDHINKVKTIKITPSATAKNVTISATTATAKYNILSLAVSDKPVPTSIKGIKDDFAIRLANSNKVKTGNIKENVVFLDQYGDEITVEAPYTFTVTDTADNNNTAYDDGTGVITSSANVGTEVYTIQLKNGDGDVLDTYEVTITVVDLKTIENFAVGDLNKFYTATSAAATHNQDIEVYGLVGGNKVLIPQAAVTYISASNGLKGITTGDTITFTPVDVDTESNDKDSVITFLVDNGSKTITVTKEVVYSNAAPAAQSFVFKKGADEVSGVISASVTELGNGIVKAVAKDQYGVEIADSADDTYILTNAPAGAAIDSARKITGVASGDEFQLNVFINGIYQSLKIIVE